MPTERPSGWHPATCRERRAMTLAEQYMADLCQRTFLRLWSYPNVYRREGHINKEVCDLLVVCGRDIVVFSNKACAFPDTGDPLCDWSRWYKRAIEKSARQAVGAERWIGRCRSALYSDARCENPLPISIGDIRRLRFHRMVVALGAKARCIAHFGGGSGSLMLVPRVAADSEPFVVGTIPGVADPVHVLDDVSLDVLLRELDTIEDFVRYLREKERLIGSGRLGCAAGEEDLLAFYLQHLGANGEHTLTPGRFDSIAIEEGLWNDFQQHQQYHDRKTADVPSYTWDRLIDVFAKSALAGFLSPSSNVDEIEPALRVMARERRVARRALVAALTDFIGRAVKAQPYFRTILPFDGSRRAYVFLVLPNDGHPEYAARRMALLQAYTTIVASRKRRDLAHVVGIGLDRRVGPVDLAYRRTADLTQDELDSALALQADVGFFTSRRAASLWHHRVQEFPVEALNGRVRRVQRNGLCPCGSRVKFRLCCGRLAP